MEAWLGGIAITNIDDNAHARPINRRVAFEAQSTIARVIADRVDLKRSGIEGDTVVGLDGTDFLETTQRELRITFAEAEQVEIAGRAMRIIEPVSQQHRTFEDELVLVLADAEPVEQPLQGILREQAVKWLVALLRKVEQAGADGGSDILQPPMH